MYLDVTSLLSAIGVEFLLALFTTHGFDVLVPAYDQGRNPQSIFL